MSSGISIITGGLGYIGQSLAQYLQDIGQSPVIVDRRTIASQVPDVPVVVGDIRDPATWSAFHDQPVRAVFHCAGLIQVAESVSDPARYFEDNIAAGIAMLRHLVTLGPVPMIFSSSAAVYGAPHTVPIAESAPLHPLSPYGVSKRQFEEILAAFHQAYDTPAYVALRYFNASGRYGRVHENHTPETHLLPLINERLKAGQPPVIYGRDYPTDDGTAVRDYIHIYDLMTAHVAALDYLEHGGQSIAVNVGAGRGVSVLQVVDAFRKYFSQMPEPLLASRRSGDPAVLVADVSRAREILEWEPRHSDIGQIVEDVVMGDEAN